jgi:hypothetical protein
MNPHSEQQLTRMFGNYNKQGRPHRLSAETVSTIVGVGIGLPVFFIVRLWVLDFRFDRDIFYIVGLCVLGTLVALWLRISRPEDDI